MLRNKGFVICIFLLCLTTICQAQNSYASRFSLIKKHFADNENEKAKLLIDEGLENNPLDSDLYMMLGKYYVINNNTDDARYNFIKSLQFNPKNLEAKRFLINLEIQTKNYSGAICYINELLEINPYLKDLWIKKINIYRLQGNTEKSKDLMRRVRQIYPEDEELKNNFTYETRQEIYKLKKEGKLEKALQLTKELIKEDDGNPEIFIDVINTHLYAGDKEKALYYVNRALELFPNDEYYIIKKSGILSELKRYNEALSFLQFKMKTTKSTQLSNTYNYTLIEAARYQKDNDPFFLYGKVFERNPKNKEALQFLVNNSIARGYFDMAVDYLKRWKLNVGETKEVLSKEYYVYRQIGKQAMAYKTLEKLFEKFPEDQEIRANYIAYKYNQGKAFIIEKQKIEAIPPLEFVVNQPLNEFTENALQSLFQVYIELGQKQKALAIINRLSELRPNDKTNELKRVALYQSNEQYGLALSTYENLIESCEDEELDFYIGGYEDLAILYLKKLMELGKSNEAFYTAEKLIYYNPDSKIAYQYAINNASLINDQYSFDNYAEVASQKFPDNLFFKLKLAQSYLNKKQYTKGQNLLYGLLSEQPNNDKVKKALVANLNTQAETFITKKQGDSLVQVMDKAIILNPKDKNLKYNKGLGFEMMKAYDSAHFYQKFYEASPSEADKMNRHLDWLKNKSYKNSFTASSTRNRFTDQFNFSTISSVNYTRKANQNTWGYTLNYSGRALGAGFQNILEYSRTIGNNFLNVSAGYATMYFPKYMGTAMFNWSLKKDYELQIGGSFRKIPFINENMYNATLGIGKYDLLGFTDLNLKGHYYQVGNAALYNIVLNTKLYVFSEKNSYTQLTAAFGSAPETSTIDLNLYDEINAINTTLGAGMVYMITDKFNLKSYIFWYNFKEDAINYVNFTSLSVSAQVSF